MVLSWGDGDLSLVLPSHPRENEAASSRPTGQGLTQLGLAWETSSCWLEGLTLRIETAVLRFQGYKVFERDYLELEIF